MDYQQEWQQHIQLFKKKKKKKYGSGTTNLIISNEEIEDIMKIVKLLEESGLLIKRINETIKNKHKKKKADFSQYY